MNLMITVLNMILISFSHLSKHFFKNTREKEKKTNKKSEENVTVFLEENIFPQGKPGKFSLNIFRGLIAR